jgi:putative membrane protein
MLIESMSIEALTAATKLNVTALVVPLENLKSVLISTLVFVLLGIIIFALAFLIIVKASPFSVRKEIEEDQNIALAIVIGAVIIGIAMIVAAAIQGS